jgi:1,4-dihydroxy-2-naphthoate octaprenyltransferase
MTYTLGAGIAHYLGQPIQIAIYIYGVLAVLTLQSSTTLFSEYFRINNTQSRNGESPLQSEQFRVMLLQVAFAFLTLSAMVTLTLFTIDLHNFTTEILMILIFLFSVAYSVPPISLNEKGYGELLLAVYLGTLLPALAFLLQYGKFHRLLSFSTIPLTLIAISYLLVCNFQTFVTDLKLEHYTLLTRLSWQRAIPVHHILILLAYMLFAVAPILGFPWPIIWPVFLVLPFATIQMIWLQQIANGGRTKWKLLTAIANITFGLTAYLLALTFWTR